MSLVINLYGGPGTGKSTTAALVFGLLKTLGVNAELVTEYAKDRVWDEHFAIFSNQIYLFGKQYHRLHRLVGKVDVIVTDAPILLSLFYGTNVPDSFRQLVYDTYSSMKNLDVFLRRKKPYNPAGRMQSEEQAKDIDVKLAELLTSRGIPISSVDGDGDAPWTIVKMALPHLPMNVVEKIQKTIQ
jgi:hypothetical protein